jgi:excinuclease ABC subunit C
MKALHLPKPPQRIECFDISHIQGVEKVASMVSFLNGRPDKSQYRKFIIRTVDGIDDFKSMAEAVGRRYRRLKNEGRKMPDLVLIDGGKGQLSAALKALDEQELKKVPIAALAKEEEEIFVPGRKESIRLPLDSAALLLLRHVRDEAHRFAITFHRARRGKRTLEV